LSTILFFLIPRMNVKGSEIYVAYINVVFMKFAFDMLNSGNRLFISVFGINSPVAIMAIIVKKNISIRVLLPMLSIPFITAMAMMEQRTSANA